jgi:glucosylceramidase
MCKIVMTIEICLFILNLFPIIGYCHAAVRWYSTIESDPWLDRGTIGLTAKTDSNPSVIEIDSNNRYQTIDGFGGCFNELGWKALNVLDSAQIDVVMGELFDPVDGCRFNICRIPIGANDYATSWYSLADTANDYRMEHFSIERDRRTLIPFIKCAMQHKANLKVWGTPWSPPAWMKENNSYSGGQNTLRWNEKVLEALALYFAKFVQAYRAEGINLYAIHVQNEPIANPNYPSCLWSGEHMRDFIRDYLGPAFEVRNIDAEIWLGTINSPDYNAYAGTVLADTAASAHISGIGYQWEGKKAIGQTYQGHPEKKLMMTEQECGYGGNSWKYGEEVFTSLVHYFNNGANSQMQWNMILDETGKSTWDWVQNSMITIDKNTGRVTYNPQFFIVKHFSHFIDSGAVRITCRGPLKDNIAFLNPDGSVVFITANMNSEVKNVTVSINNKVFAAKIPAHSYNTFIIKKETPDNFFTYDKKRCTSILLNTGSAFEYFLSKPSMVSISFFNLAGRKIRTFESQLNNAGMHHINLGYYSELSSGMYIVQSTIHEVSSGKSRLP